MFKAFKYRLYPNKSQAKSLAEMLDSHRHLYNSALAQRKDVYETEKRSVSYKEQCAWLTSERKTNPYLTKCNAASCQATLRRLSKAFDNFFRRVKIGEKPGYPRFKGLGRFDSVEFRTYGDGCKINTDRRLYIQHIGNIKVRWHRKIPVDAVIKTAIVKKQADGWYVVFTCELPDICAAESTNPPVGIDLGLKSFLVTSDGEVVDPPKFFRKAEKQLRKAQRKLARRKKGSNRRTKARELVAKLHLHVANQRRDFHHKTALDLVREYGKIAHEELSIKGISRTRLAKSTLDAGWGQFINILQFKAAEAGVEVVGVNPNNTSQACSNCGCLPDVKLTLTDRVYHCASCGLVLDRDLNAARNIYSLGFGRNLQALTWSDATCVA